MGSAAAQVAALQVMEAAVSEFSLVTASPIGLSWEYHESCRNLFEVRQTGRQQTHAVDSTHDVREGGEGRRQQRL